MKLRILGTILCFLLVGFVANAQVQTGSIEGTVFDPQKNIVLDAAVTVTDNATGAVFTGKTSGEGTFTIPGLPFGTYTVKITKDGFNTWETKSVRVITAQVTNLTANLVVGSVGVVVTVEAGAVPMEATSTVLSTDVSRKQLVDLPTQGRNPFDFAVIQAGVTSTGGAASGGSVMNGLRGSSNNLVQDGINISDQFIKTSGFSNNSGYTPTLESTGEFSISGNNIAADSGDGVVQVRITTQRGSNDYHGSLFFFARNDAFNANSWNNNFTQTPRSRLRQDRFGGNIGGPVDIPKLYHGKDRTFFFFSYSGFRENFQNSDDNTVLTASARAGMFTYKDTNGVLQSVNLLTASSRGLPINTFTQNLLSATPNPSSLPAGARLDPTTGDQLNTVGVRFNVNGSDPSDNYDLRVDHKLIDSKKLGTHWVEVDWHWLTSSTTPGADPPFPKGISPSCFGAVCNSSETTLVQDNILAVAINSTLGNSMFNEFRVGYGRPLISFLPPIPFPRAFKVNFASPIQNPEDNFDPQGRNSPYYPFIDNFTKLKGTHTIKAGFLISSSSTHRFNDFAGSLPINGGVVPQVSLGSSPTNDDGLNNCPVANFPNFPTGNKGANLCNQARSQYSDLVGLVNNISQTFNGIPGAGFPPGLSDRFFIRERAFNLYVADSWKVRPHLTFNYGLRYEIVPAADMVNKRFLEPANNIKDLNPFGPLFQPSNSVTYSSLLANISSATQLVPSGTSNGKPFWSQGWRNFAPSVGIAWQPISKTVVRAGYSISYVRDTLTIISNVATANAGLHVGSQVNPASGNSLAVLDPTNSGNVLTPPALVLPQPQIANFLGGFSSTGQSIGIEAFDPHLRSPYVQQWSLGVQRELSGSTVLEVDYVGNHSTKLYRAQDLDQVNLTSGLLGEFNQAATNLAVCNADATCKNSPSFANQGLSNSAGTQAALATLTAMNFPLFTSSTFRNLLTQNQAGQFWFLAQSNCTFRFLKSTGCAGLGNFPANFFIANPLTGISRIFNNSADANYEGLQTEIRRRFSRGLQLQANYTFAKVLTNSTGSSQSEFDTSLDLRNAAFNRTRAGFDIRHTFHFNGIYELPVGRGQRWASGGILGKVLEGWQTGGLFTWRSGAPISFTSGRNTVSQNGGANPAVALGMTDQQVCSALGLVKVAGQGAFYVPSTFIDSGSTRANLAVLGNPAAGVLGDQHLLLGCSGPGLSQIDMNFVKKTRITERTNFEFRAEFFNIFNHPNFTGLRTGINSTNFGVLTSTFTPREIQINGRFNF